MESCCLELPSYMKSIKGLKFMPTDQMLIEHYLKNKLHGLEYFRGTVFDYDLYGVVEPWQIWEWFNGVDGQDLYFFTPLKRSTNKSGQLSSHVNRKAGSAGGTWSAENSLTPVFATGSNDQVIGYCRRLRYENPQMPEHHGEWIMHEYSLHESYIQVNCPFPNYVLCRIRKNERVLNKRKEEIKSTMESNERFSKRGKKSQLVEPYAPPSFQQPFDPCAEPPSFGQPFDPCEAPPSFGQPFNQCAEPPSFGQPFDPCAEPPSFGQPFDQCAAPPSFEQPFDQCAAVECVAPPSFRQPFDQCAAPPSFGQPFDPCAEPSSFGQPFDQCAAPPSFEQPFDQCAAVECVAPPSFRQPFDQCAAPPSFGQPFDQCAAPPSFGQPFHPCAAPPSFRQPFDQFTAPPSFGQPFDQCAAPPSFGQPFDPCAAPFLEPEMSTNQSDEFMMNYDLADLVLDEAIMSEVLDDHWSDEATSGRFNAPEMTTIRDD